LKTPTRLPHLTFALALICSFVTALSGVAFGQQGGAEDNSATDTNTIPLYVRYDILFRRIIGPQSGGLGAKTPPNMDRTFYADLVRRDVQLSDEQARALVEIATECEGRVAEVNARARTIIEAARAQNQQARTQGQGELPPPPPELAQLQQERNSIILQAREKLRTALGEEAFQRLDKYVTPQPGSSRSVALPRPGRPAIHLQARATALAADGQTAKIQFRVGEKVVVQITLLNTSARTISVRQSDLNDWFELSLVEGNSRERVLFFPPEKGQDAEAARAEQSKTVELVPGQETVAGAFDLSKLRLRLKPGQYLMWPHRRVILNRPPDQSEFIDLMSQDDPVTFEVLP
jgi:hypothetical protein